MASSNSLPYDKMSAEDREGVFIDILHDLYVYSSINMQPDKVHKLLDNIGNFCYAFQVGNGQLSEEEQMCIITRAFINLREV
jgi:hypothetical protein